MKKVLFIFITIISFAGMTFAQTTINEKPTQNKANKSTKAKKAVKNNQEVKELQKADANELKKSDFIEEEEVPNAVMGGFASKYPEATDAKFNVGKNDTYNVKFNDGGKYARTTFDKKGNWIETENAISEENVPMNISSAFKKDFPQAKVINIKKVSSPKGDIYDYQVKGKKSSSHVQYDSKGKLVDKNALMINKQN